jgi:hypothetical protein
MMLTKTSVMYAACLGPHVDYDRKGWGVMITTHSSVIPVRLLLSPYEYVVDPQS